MGNNEAPIYHMGSSSPKKKRRYRREGERDVTWEEFREVIGPGFNYLFDD